MKHACRVLVVILGSSLMACSPVKPIRQRDISQSVRVIDQVDEKRIEVQLQNETNEAWCIDSGAWPNVGGSLSFSSQYVWIEAGGRMFRIRDENTGYCADLCTIRILPGRGLTGHLPYSEFGLPESVFHDQKHLVFPLIATLC
jgi:hypothetical protein